MSMQPQLTQHSNNSLAGGRPRHIDGLSPETLAKNSEGNPVGASAPNNKKSRNSNQDNSQESDSFYKYYNKVIQVSEKDYPIVLLELVDAAYNYILRENYEKALVLLQKTEGVLDVVSIEQSQRDRYIAYTTFHNMAMCYQKLGMLEDCYFYLKECLQLLTEPLPNDQHFYKSSSENCVAARMKKLKQECKVKLQLCAILSQTQNHAEALDNAKKSVKIVHQLFKDLLSLCALYIKKIQSKEVKNKGESSIEEGEEEARSGSHNFLEESISMIEKTSIKLYPVVREVIKRLIQETEPKGSQFEKAKSEMDLEKFLQLEESEISGGQPDMRSVLGFLNQNEWVYQLNIGNIMQLQPVSLKQDMLSQCRNEVELSRDSFLEKIALLSVSYFCVSTEMRFLLQSREQYLSPPLKKTRELESEFWHAKSLEIACTFLPSECPLLNHVLISYQKHHDPAHQTINEDQEQNDVVTIIRPLNGIESSKHQPMVRQLTNVKVLISPFQISPITKRVFSFQKQYHTKHPQIAPVSAATVSSNISSGAQVAGSVIQQNDIQNKSIKEEAEIVLFDQAELPGQLNRQLPPQISNNQSQAVQPVSSSVYSEDFYEQFVKRIFDDNPQLDKRQLVTKFLSHLQSQDYSFLQQQINEQHLLQDEEDEEEEAPVNFRMQKEQRQTLIKFGEEEEERQESSPSSEILSPPSAVNIEDIMMINKSNFEIIKQLKGFEKKGQKKKQQHLSGLDQPIPISSPDDQESKSHQKSAGILGGGGVISSSQTLPKYTSGNLSSSGHSSSKNNSRAKQTHHQPKIFATSNNILPNKKGTAGGPRHKLMSYLEGGDSLLKEIERSLENQEADKDMLTFEDDEDLLMIPSQKKVPDDKLRVVYSDEEDDDPSQRMAMDHQKFQAAFDIEEPGMSSNSEMMMALNDEEADDEQDGKEGPRGTRKLVKSPMIKEKAAISNGKQKSAKSINKSSTSFTRPSSSITNHTSMTGGILGGRRSSHSLLHNKQQKMRQNNQNRIRQQFTSQQQHQISQQPVRVESGSPILSSPSKDSQKAHCGNRQGAFTSINVGISSQKIRNTNQNKLDTTKTHTKSQNRVLTKTSSSMTGVINHSAQKRGRQYSKNLKSHQQLTSFGVGNTRSSISNTASKERSKSRQSHQQMHNHFKSMGAPQNQSRLSNNPRQPGKSKSSEEEGGRSSSSKHKISRPQSSLQNYPLKKRENSAEMTSQQNNPETVTPGGKGNQNAFLSQPSFSDHTNTGSKTGGGFGNLAAHNYSFDVSMLHHPSKGIQSITSLQQKVMENQRLLLQFQQQQQQQQQRKLSGSVKGQKRRQKGAQTQDSMLQMLAIAAAASSSMDNSKQSSCSQSRSKSLSGTNGAKRPSAVGSMSTTSGLKFQGNFQGPSNQQMDQHASRQSALIGGMNYSQSGYSTHKQNQSLLLQNSSTSLIQSSNKENLGALTRAAANLLQSQLHTHQAKRNSIGGGPLTSSGGKKKSIIRELKTGLLNHQKSLSRELNRQKLDHHPTASQQAAFTRSMLDHQSPSLYKKKRPSQSPQPKKSQTKSKHNVDTRIQNVVRKVANERPRSAAKRSRHWEPEGQMVFAQNDECLNISTSGDNYPINAPKQTSSFIEQHQQVIANLRPSFGVGPIHRGSSDVIQLYPSQSQIEQGLKTRNSAVTLLKQLVANSQAVMPKSLVQPNYQTQQQKKVQAPDLVQRKMSNLRA